MIQVGDGLGVGSGTATAGTDTEGIRGARMHGSGMIMQPQWHCSNHADGMRMGLGVCEHT